MKKISYFIIIFILVLSLTACGSKSTSTSKKSSSDNNADQLIEDRIKENANKNKEEDKKEENKDTDNKNEISKPTNSETNEKHEDSTNNSSSNSSSKPSSKPSTSNKPTTTTPNNTPSSPTKNNLVSYNGNLKVNGTSIVNQYGEKIQLKGISSHGLQWYGDYINQNNIKVLRDDWHSNIFRVAMYTSEGGYIQNRNLRDTLIQKVDMLISMDMYVIIDWHILSDGNPMTYVDEAKEFFAYVSKKYANTPNVIYEICNEPNGANWNSFIKPYADQVIPVIRQNSKNSIIIVGTNTWSQDILEPINNRINDNNVMYAVHFYAGTHTQWLRDRVKQALNAGIPVFITEWGTSSADGNGGVYEEESKKWINFMKENNISWCNWSLSDKNETSALLSSGAGKNGINNLSKSGQIVKEAIKN